MSITLETDFCVEVLQDAMNRNGQLEILNSPCEGGQGVQFTSAACLGELETQGVWISMDGKGQFMDNIFIERLWRSTKRFSSRHTGRYPRRASASASG